MRSLCIAAFVLFYGNICIAQAGNSGRKVILIGEPAGDRSTDRILLDEVKSQVGLDSNSILVFLGNYGDGPDQRISVLKARAEFVSGTPAKAVFISGNKDWDEGGHEGYNQVMREAAYIRALGNANITCAPGNGCPGPEKIEIGGDADLVIMNTQWWLHKFDKPGMESGCGTKNRQQILDELTDIVESEKEKLLIFIGHHPFESTGIRSGYFGLKQHLFPLTDIPGMRNFYLPLPVVGSLYPLSRNTFISRQDMVHSAYEDMTSSIDEILDRHPYVIRAAGHEHNQQLYRKNNNYYIVTGGGKNPSRVARTKNTLFASEHSGFSVIEITPSGQAGISFYKLSGTRGEMAFSSPLLDFSRLPPVKDTTVLAMINGDSVTSVVNCRFSKAAKFKRWLAGNNYRAEWAAPVKLKVFKLHEEKGGMKITGQGGGNMTKTIRMADASGKKWSVRSVNKDPERLVPENFRNTLAEDVAADMISAGHPYAPLVAAPLTKALGLAQAEQAFYFLPNDTALGYYRPGFANTVVMLEEREPSLYGEDTKNSWEVINEHLEKNNKSVDQRTYLKARMLDVILADYDRHYEQWKWGTKKVDGNTVYYAIPKDRDQALFYSDGLGLKLVTTNRLTYLRGLQHSITNIKSLGYVGRDVDAFFLNELQQQDWKQVLDTMKLQLSDDVIAGAVKELPASVYALSGAEINSKLRDRKNAIDRKGMEYYKFLAARVNVVGSMQDEHFVVTGNDSGVLVNVFNAGRLSYSRQFDPSVTREVRMYGLSGNDYFDVDEGVNTRIKFRMVGGSGADSFNIKGRAGNVIYDNAREANVILNRRRTTSVISRREDVNNYNFREENHNSHRFPTFSAGYNPEDILLVGIGLTIKRRGFRNEGYPTFHRITSLISIANQAYQLNYRGEFIDIYRHYDLALKSDFINPTLNNFFGYGNASVYDKSHELKYYAVRYSWLSAEALMRKRFFHNKASLAIGPVFNYYWNNKDRASGRILANPEQVGLESSHVFSKRTYAGGKITAGFNSVDNLLLPARGLDWTAEFSVMKSLNTAMDALPAARSDVSVYAPFSKSKRLILAIHAGGAHLFSDQFEYFQAFSLGAENYLRGYQKNRFTGSSRAYGSLELRARLFDLKSHIIPGELGLVGINDNGKVWMKEVKSTPWHHAVGGGIYFTPFHTALISAVVAVSDEGALLNVSVGSRLNITF